jgi:hypothetical protein
MKYLFLLILSLILSRVSAQDITITGNVIDDDTEESIPFANVYILGTNNGVTTDIDGNYTLTFNPSEGDSIGTNSMGYTDLGKPFKKDLTTQEINFRMKSTSLEIQEIVVLAGENPANQIIRDIIANKPNNDIEQSTTSYETELYSKTELDLVNITPEMKDRKIFKKLQFIFENIDTVSDVKPFLPAYVAERFYDVYNVQGMPKKTLLTAQRVSGVKNQTVVDFINSMNSEYNIYDNFIKILGKEFISPFSNQGLVFYEYYIMDSTTIKGKWSYKLKFKPRDKSTNSFYGDFWVSMEDHALLLVNMRMNPEVNINLVNRIIIYQEYTEHEGKHWIPLKQKTVIDFATSRKDDDLGIIGRKTSSYKGFRINTPEAQTAFKAIDPEEIDYNNLERPDTFWAENRHEKLSKNESGVYEMVDSVQNIPVFKTVAEIANIVISGYKTVGPIQIGPYSKLIGWNDVEGFRLSLGVGTSPKLSKKFRIYGYAGYGFKDKKWKYGGRMQYVFNRYRRHAVGVSFFNDATFEVRSTEENKTQSLFAGWLRRAVPQKMMYVIEGKAWYQKTWKRGFSNRLALVHRRIDPVGYQNTRFGGLNFKFLKAGADGNRVDTVSNVITSEVVFKTRWAYKEKLISGPFQDVSLGSKFPIIELAYTAGIRGILDSEYDYHKLRLSIRHWFYTSPAGYVEYYLEAGKVFSANPLPYLLLEVHPGNEAYFYNKNSYNSMNSFEFISDFFVHARVEHHWDGFILNRIPFIRKHLKWRLVTAVRATWGTLSDKNYQANRLNHYNREIKRSSDRPAPFTEGPFYGTFDRGPYAEASLGIENIFQFIRVDALWRINYLDNRDAQRFSVRVTLNFDF